MSVLAWVFFGLVVGIIAKLVMPGRDPGGCLLTILIGIAGSFVGGFLGRALGLYGEHVTTGGIVMSILGAVTILVIYRILFGRPGRY